MRTFSAGFTAAKNAADQAPVWILRLVGNGVDYWISDGVYTIVHGGAGWPATVDITTLSWVAVWGAIRESISGNLGEILIADFSLTLLNDEDDANNIQHLAVTYPLEQDPCELYLWFDGLNAVTDPPQMMFRGNVRDLEIPDDTEVQLDIEDENAKLNNYIGTLITSEAYPLCDPDVVGKMIPINLGTVNKSPALCVESGWVTSTINDLTENATNIIVSELPAYSVINKTITIDDEQMLITKAGGSTVRENKALGSNGAIASASSSYSAWLPGRANNGNRVYNTTNGDTWISSANATPSAPEWLRITFANPMMIDEINVFGLADNIANPGAPTLADIGTQYVQPTFDIYLSPDNGTTWILIQAVTGNNKVWYQTTFAAQLATMVQVNFKSKRLDNYNIVCAELEAWGTEVPSNAKNITVLRGANNTVAVTHSKGSTVVEKKSTPLVYLCTDHPLDEIGTVMARVRGVFVDITSDVTKYLGTPTNQLAAYPGKAAITIPDFAKVQQRITLALSGDVSASDPGHTHNAGSLSSTASQDQDATGTNTTLGQGSAAWTAVANQNKFPGAQYFIVKSVNFAVPNGTPYAGTMTATVTAHIPSTGGCWYLQCGGKRITPVYGNGVDNFSPAITHDATSIQGNTVQLVIGAYATGQSAALTAYGEGTITACHRQVTYNTTQAVSIVPSGSGVNVTNTLGLSGNSVSDIMIGDLITVDTVKNFASIEAQFDWLLTNYCNDTTLQITGTIPPFYRFNGSIREYKRAIEVLDYLAFQCACFFRRMTGVSRLIKRSNTLVSQKTIPAVRLSDEGTKMLSRKKAPITDIINKIQLRYDRDWSSAANQAEAYQHAVTATDANSISIYGTQERPDLFMFDFVTDPQMANDILGFCLAFYAARPWRLTFSTFLDHCELEFADCVTLGFLNDTIAQIVEAGIQPGSIDTMDGVTFTVVAPTIRVAPNKSILTMSGNPLITTNRRFITHG